MAEYVAPLNDMQFVLDELIDLPRLLSLPYFEGLEASEMVAVLQQASEFASGVLSPLNRVGDTQGCTLHDGVVTTAPGWRQAYQQFAADGWNGLSSNAEIGGTGLPTVIAALVEEMWHGANCAFALCPMLTRSGIEALDLTASDTLKKTYLPHLVSGRWTATMNLTEPQAGSDLGAVQTRAVPQPDGSFAITGQKIFITYGEHDLTENIIHMVLARTPSAPAGVKGISLFLVPKHLLAADGSVGDANALHCVSIEHKLGIHASPTCVMQYGDGSADSGATGWLVGEESRGLEYMFIMMNAARFSVGVQGLGLAERAYQAALSYAKERRQGSDPHSAQRSSVAIVRHADVRRMLLQMKSTIEAMRALAAVLAEAVELARSGTDAAARERASAFVGLMTPVMKGWSTENAIRLASLAIQVHGGMGYVEETGVAQYLRDARITTIYEGTTGIQANDLVGRKVLRDRGAAIMQWIADMRPVQQQLSTSDDDRLLRIGLAFDAAISALERAVQSVLAAGTGERERALAAAEPLLMTVGVVAGGWQLARSALAAQRRLQESHGEPGFYHAKILTALFYAEHTLPHAAAYANAVVSGADSILEIGDEQL